MASGDFHDSSSHSGDFHSSGGGGSFGGGGSSGGGGSYDGGDYSGGGGGDFMGVIVVAVALLYYFFTNLGQGNIPGLNFVNLFIFLASAFILFLGLKENYRTAVLREIKRNGPYKNPGYVHGGKIISRDFTDSKTSYGYNKSYFIAFYDHDFGDANAEKVCDLIKRTPKIVWMSPYVWLLISIVSFVSTFFYYETVIPYFENKMMTDLAFKFFDYLTFYFPSIVCLLSAVACLVFVKVKDKLLYECAVRIVDDNNAAMKRLKTQERIAGSLSNKWYYNNCPNCGAKATMRSKTCFSCGSSLEADFAGGGKPTSFHRIPVESENPADAAKGNKKTE